MKKYLVINRQGEAMCATDDPLDAEQFKNRHHRPCWVFARVDSYTGAEFEAAVDAVRDGIASVVGTRLADAAVGRGPTPTPEQEADTAEYLDHLTSVWAGAKVDLNSPFVKALIGQPEGISREEWLEQYTQTPRPTRDVVIDALLSGKADFSREYLEDLPDRELLGIVEASDMDRELRNALRRLVDATPPKSIYHHCPYCLTLAIYNHSGNGTPVCKCPDKKCKGHDRWLEYDEFAAPVVVPANPWIDHNGGPCPVRHEEVEVLMRSQFDHLRHPSPYRCWPEAVNWHWGRPGVDATPIDVLKWRRV